MKSSEGAALAVTTLLIYSLVRKSAAVGTLNFFPDKVRDLAWEGLTPVLLVGLGVQNTSNQNFTINSIAANVFADDYYVGNISFFQQQIVSPNSQGILIMKVRLALISIVNDIINAWNTGDFEQDIEIKGDVNVDNLQLPLKLKYKIGL